ncbi:MAG: RND transporter [Gammaproteobacteria bacterium RIFCSPHIGHO2_12_FULL_45_9]|nr:MAG: RND transporter [Gammaproteobacteria bacterium RIFCSPHIGHO2_12_FULL_45_9]
MWLVRIALSKPYTFIVLALLLLIAGTLSIARTPKDIFPNINIPVVSIVWSYAGLLPEEMAGRITTTFERSLTTTVNDIEHLESQSLLGVSVVKVFFHSGTDIATALAQVTAISQTTLRNFPPGTLPPLILSYSASSVPILNLVLSSSILSEPALNDLAMNFLRSQLAVVQGASVPYPYGGKLRQIQVDLNPEAMQAYGVSPLSVNQVVQQQNLILPAGTEKIGPYEYFVKFNGSPIDVNDMNGFPIKKVDDTVIYLRDVAYVNEGSPPQTNMINVNGTRAVLLPVEKTGSSSTLTIIQQIKALLPHIIETLPSSLKLSLVGDQSLFVQAAVDGVLHESLIATLLTGIVILLFVGSMRSTIIVVISIPLSMLASIVLFSALGETINIMTLGGLALSVGVLVDNATVTIENINWNLEQGKTVEGAIVDGAQQIAVPTLVSTLCICIVFVPMFFLSGVAHYLFLPMAEAVVFAVLASYLLSRTLVPTLSKYWLVAENHAASAENLSAWVRFQRGFNECFEALKAWYVLVLKSVLVHKKSFIMLTLFGIVGSLVILMPWVGSDFFPTVDAGQMKLHIRAPTGTRIEETARICAQIESAIRQRIPANELTSMVDNIGIPVSGINLSYSNSYPTGPFDADILISLATKHHPVANYMHLLREILPRQFPGVTFSFLPADMVTQILNFGLPAPIDIQVVGLNQEANRLYTNMLLKKVLHVPGIVDAHVQQVQNYPQLNVLADRSFSQELMLTEQDILNNALISLSGSFQITPTFWLNTQNGVSYPVDVQTPQYYLDSLQDLQNIPVTPLKQPLQILGAVSTVERTMSPAVVSDYDIQPVFDIFASIQDRDLGGVARDIQKVLKDTAHQVPRGSLVIARGQMQTLTTSFTELFAGLAFAVVLVYFLIVINFQSWLDPFIVITALPASLAGIAWMLFLTHTTLSVPALTGAIMCMGVATANSILVISFARSAITEGKSALDAILEAGASRLRPVLMTALAMIIGMCPMALGLGAGGEQNAPLGRAVIGGLIFATIATLLFVPAVFSIFHREQKNVSQ